MSTRTTRARRRSLFDDVVRPLTKPSIQRAQREAEQLGRQRLVAARVAQGGVDARTLDLFEGLADTERQRLAAADDVTRGPRHARRAHGARRAWCVQLR